MGSSNKKDQTKAEVATSVSIETLVARAMKGDAKARAELGEIKKVRVRARILHGDDKVVGYYGVRRIREGQVFVLKSMADFSPKWMERVSVDGMVLTLDGHPARLVDDTDVVQTDEDSPETDADSDVI